MQFTANFNGCKIDNFEMKTGGMFLIFAQNLDCRYKLEPPPLTSTNNLCFRAKIRNK